jgi:hypothetical protein
VIPAELDRLAKNLSDMHAELPHLGKVEFKPVEPNVTLTFELTRTGQILGHFVFRPNLAEDTVLKGSFDIDQTYLPNIARGIRAFLESSSDCICSI